MARSGSGSLSIHAMCFSTAGLSSREPDKVTTNEVADPPNRVVGTGYVHNVQRPVGTRPTRLVIERIFETDLQPKVTLGYRIEWEHCLPPRHVREGETRIVTASRSGACG